MNTCLHYKLFYSLKRTTDNMMCVLNKCGLCDAFDEGKKDSIGYNVLTEAIVKITSSLENRHQAGTKSILLHGLCVMIRDKSILLTQN